MVNSINLTMTNKDQIATWKANRRKLVRLSTFPEVRAYTPNFVPEGLLNSRNTRLHRA